MSKINKDIYKWDLSKIYNDLESFNKDYNLVSKKIESFSKYEDTMLCNCTLFYEAISLSYEIERMIDKLTTYTSCLFDEDTSNNKNQELKGKVNLLKDKYDKISYFVVPSILKLDKETLDKYYVEETRLKDYSIVINNIFRYKEHTLSDKEELMLSSLSKMLGNNYETYELLKDSDLKFKKIKNEKGKRIELTNSNYSLYIESNNREVRKDVFNTLYNKYKQYKNTFASCLLGNVRENITIMKLKKYSSCLEESLYRDELDIKVYNNVIDTINDNLNILHKYYALKKDILGVDELHIYDVYAPLIKDIDIKYPYEIAKENVLNALSVMGNDYIKIVKEALNNRWIDVYPKVGKRTGGYSGGSYDTIPYILLNYQDKYNDMSTLAHEMGHSIHSYFTRNNNPYQYGDYTIFVAEVASTVNELLLSFYMLNNSNKKEEKLYILNNLMELFRATIYRQTMFSEFEKEIYECEEKNNVLTADSLSEIYLNLNKKYFGKDVVIDEEIKYEWERIPHLYYNFYVYKYVTGLSCACYIVNNVINKGETDKYLEFLKCGRTKNPLESLKIVGIDLTKKDYIEESLKMFEEIMNNFRNMI